MDPLPQIPATRAINDTASLIRDTFAEKLENEVFPTDIADNIRTYSVDDNLSLKENANNVYGVYRCLENDSNVLNNTEYDILKQHGDYLFTKSVIEKNEFLKEVMKLRACEIFTTIYLSDKIKFGLIEKSDLYPDLTRQFLDFRFNTTLHQCKRCFPKLEAADKISRHARKKAPSVPAATRPCDPSEAIAGLQLEPPEITFKNFQLKTVYEQIVKIKNISAHMQKISIQSYPKCSVFVITIDTTQKMAPGMYIMGTIKFVPETFTNLHDEVSFISRKGEVITLSIKCYRDPPKLSAFIHKSIQYPKIGPERIPGSKDFSIKRQHAVNNTIDCGSCFATEHVLISLILSNNGNRAKFFWLLEEEFCYQDINAVSTSLELTKDCFWIYPTYFEMLPGDICEINILFQPLHCGLQTQNLILMCDNNTYKQIEIIGDGVSFNRNLISVGIPYHTTELETKEGHCIFMGYVRNKEKLKFTLSILNRSSLHLKYALKFGIKDETFSMYDWIKIANITPAFLAPHSNTDVIFEMECPSDVSKGYYNAKLRLFIKDIPIASLEAEEKFLISINDKPLQDVTENLSVVDVLIMEVEVACCVDPQPEIVEELPPPVECEGCGNLNCSCTVCKENMPLADLEFGHPLLEFGILPIGADIKKEFHISNISEKELKWSIVEMKYNIDSQPYVEVVKKRNLSSFHGSLPPHKKHHITYSIIRKKPARYVSILVLFSVKENTYQDDNIDNSNLIAESICVVTYEITEMNIVIKTGQSTEPILCPMQMLYTGVPTHISFKIRNYSPIAGCFYFLKPFGSDVDKVDLEYIPQSGELDPGSSKKIRLKLTCYDLGILENIFLPCFIGKNQEPIQLRLLCVVDCVHVFFYLPTKCNEFQKVLWPPKVVYEYDQSWSNYCMCEELLLEYENTINSIQSEHAVQMTKRSNETLNDIKNSRMSIPNEPAANTDESGSQNILKALVSVDSDIFLQECVMEVRGVINKEPKKITIYFENVTPKSAKYSVQSANYAARENNIKAYLGPKYKKTEDLWEPMIEKYGIVVQPEIESGYMKAQELVAVDIWIYANTWGIYAEEIIVDIENIVPFSFSLIIEVLGCPVQLPMGIGTITKYPTIRFGSAAFESEPITREVIIRNISSIDLTVSWHVFYFKEDSTATSPFNFICDVIQKSEEQLEFNFTDRFFGIESFDCIEVTPRSSDVGQGEQTSISLVFKPEHVKCHSKKCQIQCFILGRIFMREDDRIKSSYFYRKYNSLVLEVTTTLEMPNLNIEIEDDTLQIYANEVAVKRQTNYYIKCIIRNPTSSTIKAQLDCMEPFSFGKTDYAIVLEAGKCKEIHLPCILTYEKILKWAPSVYRLTGSGELRPSQSQAPESNIKLSFTTSYEKIVDSENKMLTFRKKLYIYCEGGYKNVIPINVNIYYPNIAVKPVHVKFGYILLGRTQNAEVLIYNLTGCVVLFEIYKSMSSQELVVTPPHGEIEKSTGMNHSFTKISIYFTPTECKLYHESIRIVTNIPQYYIDIPIKGAGSFNEKFD